ncbi:MAG: TnsA endonuclease N-terminal domain-containing protein [Thiomicrospira sp.]
MTRKIPLNYRNITGSVRSVKSDNYTDYESGLERDAFILVEFDTNVSQFKAQPRTFYYVKDGKKRRYTPDVLVEYKNGQRLYIEIKYRDDLKNDWKKLKPKFKAAIHELKKEPNTRFKIWTEVEIRNQYFENAKYLLPFKNKPINNAHVAVILKVVNSLAETTPADLLDICSSNITLRAEILHTLWGCLARGMLKIDMLKPITMNSPIWLTTPQT